MADELIDLALAVAADAAIDKAAKHRKWVRVLRAVAGLLLCALIAAAVFITFRYS